MNRKVDGNSSLGHFPSGRWQFDEAVVGVFDDMLSRSIPEIESMRTTVDRCAERLVQPNTDIVDLGCARGDGINSLIESGKRDNRFVAVETSEPMLAACRDRFCRAPCSIDFQQIDLRVSYPSVRASVTLCILTLQFIPVEHRFDVVSRIRASTVPGGGLILVEKVLGETPFTNGFLSDQYYRHKLEKGYSRNEIDAKKASLEGVLVPLTATWNEQLLRACGFAHVECIWRCLNFCGWIAVA